MHVRVLQCNNHQQQQHEGSKGLTRQQQQSRKDVAGKWRSSGSYSSDELRALRHEYLNHIQCDLRKLYELDEIEKSHLCPIIDSAKHNDI